MEFDDDDLSFELEEEPEKPPPQPAVPRKLKRKRVEGFYEEYIETKEDGKIVRRGKRSSYDHHDWRWKQSKYEQRINNLYYFCLGFFLFALLRAFILFG